MLRCFIDTAIVSNLLPLLLFRCTTSQLLVLPFILAFQRDCRPALDESANETVSVEQLSFRRNPAWSCVSSPSKEATKSAPPDHRRIVKPFPPPLRATLARVGHASLTTLELGRRKHEVDSAKITEFLRAYCQGSLPSDLSEFRTFSERGRLILVKIFRTMSPVIEVRGSLEERVNQRVK